MAAFVPHVEAALQWLSASDPRLAVRTGAAAPDALVDRIGTEAVLAEDVTAQVRGRSLDLFAFRARAHALDEAARQLASFPGPLPEAAPPDAPLARPRLERELVERLIAEERERADDEGHLGDASGDLVRAVVETWTQPATPDEWPARDVWLGTHLLEIRQSLRDGRPRTGPLDLDVALYPLERLLAPLPLPRGSAAIAQLRMAIDDLSAAPPLVGPARLVRGAKVHLGVEVDPATIVARLERIEATLRELATQALAASGDARLGLEARARAVLLQSGPCPAVAGTRVRAMAPPPERAAICGALRAALEEAPAAALVALHDDVLFAFSAVTTTPPLRTKFLSHPENDVVDALERTARERPELVLGAALAAEIVYGGQREDERLGAWRALGEAPLDVVIRELGASR